MPGYTKQQPQGYLENEYSTDWPGLITSLPSSRIPPGAATSANGASIRGRLQSQPGVYPLTGSGGIDVVTPTFAAGENICLQTNLQAPGNQQGFTVIITNIGVYVDYVATGGSTKTFTNIFNFPNSYARYARFGSQIIGNVLYFSSAQQRGVYALRPLFHVARVEVTNQGGYFDSGTPTVIFSDGGGTGATGTATLSGQNVTAVAVTAPGSGYYAPPLISFNGGSTTGPTGGQSTASAVGILSTRPDSYGVAEITALTGVASVTVTAGGSGYVAPVVTFIGGGGTGALATATQVAGVITGIAVNSSGNGYTSAPTVHITDGAGTGATATAVLFQGKPFIGGDFMATIAQRLILGNIIGGDGNTTVPVADVILTNQGTGYATDPTVDFVGGGGEGATAIATATGSLVVSVTVTKGGTFYYSTPAVNLLSNTGTGAAAIAQLGNIPTTYSSDTAYPDRIAWSAPDAYGYFDPDFGIAPGGFDTLTEARGVVSALAVIEGALFVGHNGGETETTPNTSSSLTPFSFFPLWSADQTVLVRYGSLAQYGSTACFLGNDSAYMLSPNGLQEIGQNIANLLQGAGLWNNGSFPLQGLYGSIVEIEGQKHYLIAFSSDDWDFQHGNSARQTLVYDYNMAEMNWHTWSYPGVTATCAIYQSIDTATYAGANSSLQLAKDNWMLLGSTKTGSPTPITGAAISVSEASFSAHIPFNYVARGTPVQQFILIENPGDANLVVSSIAVTGPNAGDFVLGGPTSFTVAPGSINTLVNITFTPSAAFETSESATLTITSNAVAGTGIFTLTGISANPGSTAGPYSPSPSFVDLSAMVPANTGNQTFTSSVLTFPSVSVAGGQTVNLHLNIAANMILNIPPIGGGGGCSFQFEYSTDAGSSWGTALGLGGTSTQTFPTQDVYIPITGLLNLVNLQVRTVMNLGCGTPGPGTGFSVEGDSTVSGVSATISTPGDVYCQILQTNPMPFPRALAPVIEFGTVDPANTYISNVITLKNPTTTTMIVSLTADAGNGYSIINQTGSTTLAPNNGSQLTFNLQLANPQPGSHDDTTALSITIPGQVGALAIEAWYSTTSGEIASITEICPVNKAIQFSVFDAIISPTLSYIFRVESPAIGRLLTGRRILMEFENLRDLYSQFFPITLSYNFTLYGQQDPVNQASASLTPQINTPLSFTEEIAVLGPTTNLDHQTLCCQVDMSAFSGVCSVLQLTAGFCSIVRLTQVSDLPKAQVP